MKIVVNRTWGGFRLPTEFANTYGASSVYDDWNRLDDALIDWVETHDCKDGTSNLVVVEIPDSATDFRISDYDGMESILYVVNGKIYQA